MKVYVVGFLFTPDRHHVALIQKLKPAWQKGKLNGIGGKVEDGETPAEAMVREFTEEAGISFSAWECFLNMSVFDPANAEHSRLFFFRGTLSVMEDARRICSMTDEHVSFYDVSRLLFTQMTIIPNLRWLLPFALAGEKGIIEMGDTSTEYATTTNILTVNTGDDMGPDSTRNIVGERPS